MSLQVQQTWEYQLLGWAEEAFKTQVQRIAFTTDSTLLETAYHHCDTMTKFHSKTFYLASGLLPEAKRRAARALYAFCRVTDNIVDSASSETERLAQLEKWRKLITSEHADPSELVALAWADTQQRFNIPRGYAQQLIDGVARDLTQKRYKTFTELAGYSYGVASTVGLMAMHIIGFKGEIALPYAVKLGVALQMTNILRDIAEDWRAGRLYLPQDELEAYGLSEEAIHTGRVTPQWKEFMRFQIDRNRRLYEQSTPGIGLLDRDGRFAIGAAADLYRAILDDIEDHDYNVFQRRAHIGLAGKLSRLPLIWWRSRRNDALT
jgi:15-cis-phytoene synthase